MRTIDRSKIKNILVISLSNIGDTILTTPVVSVLRQHFPSSSLSVLASPKSAPIFTNSETVNEVILFDKHASWLEKLGLVFKLRKKRFDLVIDLKNTAIPLLIGARYRNSFFVDRSAVSMRQRHLDQLRFIAPLKHEKNQFHFSTEGEKQNALQKLRRAFPNMRMNHFAVLAPGAGSSLKRWTIGGFAQLADYLGQQGMQIVLVGEAGEIGLGKDLEQKISKRCANLIGLLTLRELAGLIEQASLVVANDSAVMHLAHELNRPTVSIFGPTDEKKYSQTGPNRRTVRLNLDCTPCEIAKCRLERRMCLDDLPAEAVIQACESLLNHVAH